MHVYGVYSVISTIKENIFMKIIIATLLLFGMISCGSFQDLNTSERNRLDCIDYLLDKGVSMDDAMRACKYAIRRGETDNFQPKKKDKVHNNDHKAKNSL